MSMPLDTPAAVMIRRSRCSTTRSLAGDRRRSFGEDVHAPLQCVVAVSPSSSPAAASTSEPVHTDVVNVVVSWAVRTQSSTSLVVRPAARVPTPPGNTTTSGRRQLVERGVDLDAEEAVVRAHDAALVADERDVEAGDALQHLVRARCRRGR